MTYNAETPVSKLIDACNYSFISEFDTEQYEPAKANAELAAAELARRSELAAKYERLTRALYGRAYSETRFVWGSGGKVKEMICIAVPERGEDWADMSGEGIAAAIIAADDEEQAKR